MPEQGTVTFEDHAITYLNFSGNETQFNIKGSRNFCVVLSEHEAQTLLRDGWNVRQKEGKEPGDDAFYYLQVAVRWGFKPPIIVMITSKGRTILTEDMVGILDAVDIAKVDMVVRPRDWETPTGSGRKAYLKTMFVTIDEDELMMKYGFEPQPMDDEDDDREG